MSIAARRTLQGAVVLLLTLGVGLASTPAHAQVELKPGIRAGATAASFGGDEEEFAQRIADQLATLSGSTTELTTGARSGFTIGGFFACRFCRAFFAPT